MYAQASSRLTSRASLALDREFNEGNRCCLSSPLSFETYFREAPADYLWIKRLAARSAELIGYQTPKHGQPLVQYLSRPTPNAFIR